MRFIIRDQMVILPSVNNQNDVIEMTYNRNETIFNNSNNNKLNLMSTSYTADY